MSDAGISELSADPVAALAKVEERFRLDLTDEMVGGWVRSAPLVFVPEPTAVCMFLVFSFFMFDSWRFNQRRLVASGALVLRFQPKVR